MANHRSGTQQLRFARWVWVAFVIVIVLALLAALSVVFVNRNKTSSNAADCDRSTILNVIADPSARATAEKLTSDYSKSNPSTHDSCITPKIAYANTAQAIALFHSSEGDLPAAWIPAGSLPGATQNNPGGTALDGSEAEIDSSVLVARQQLGTIHSKNSTKDKASSAPMYPRDSTWSAYAASAQFAKDHPSGMDLQARDSSAREVAATLSPTSLSDAVSSVSSGNEDLSVAAPQSLGGDNTEFSPIGDATVDFPLLTMSSSPRVTEYQARAAANFSEFARSHSASQAAEKTPAHDSLSNDTKELAYAASSQVSGELPPVKVTNSTTTKANNQASGNTDGGATTDKTVAQQSPEKTDEAKASQKPDLTHQQRPSPASTLLLLDTSESMRNHFDVIQSESARSLQEAGRHGRVTSLWSFSSPMETVQPYRNHVDLSIGDRGARSASMVSGLTTGGTPFLYESTVAAMLNASISGPAPKRVVIVTDSTNAGRSMNAANARLQADIINKQSPVQVDVIALGDNVDPWLREVSQLTNGRYHAIAKVTDASFPQALTEAAAG
ncbi:vWA domain-containing protein [uncultured Corynebacterium sp.]|uniref:vWA domain-containing protein n=1 Tax=uncultured Corynebacterium sp. TaxID=159447 RepID=UPI0025CD0605|nr:vWA domain-containing protein [uncultured Corynebacterium sp.]